MKKPYENIAVGILQLNTKTKSELIDVLYLIVKYIYPDKNLNLSIKEQSLLAKENLAKIIPDFSEIDRVKHKKLLKDIAHSLGFNNPELGIKNQIRLVFTTDTNNGFNFDLDKILAKTSIFKNEKDKLLVKSLAYSDVIVTFEFYKLKSDRIMYETHKYCFEDINSVMFKYEKRNHTKLSEKDVDFTLKVINREDSVFNLGKLLNQVDIRKNQKDKVTSVMQSPDVTNDFTIPHTITGKSYKRTKKNLELLVFLQNQELYDYQEEDICTVFGSIVKNEESDCFGDDLIQDLETLFSIINYSTDEILQQKIKRYMCKAIQNSCKVSLDYGVIGKEDWLTNISIDNITYYVKSLIQELEERI